MCVATSQERRDFDSAKVGPRHGFLMRRCPYWQPAITPVEVVEVKRLASAGVELTSPEIVHSLMLGAETRFTRSCSSKLHRSLRFKSG